MPSNPIDNESPTPTFASRNLSSPHITALPMTAFFILRPPIQPNIKPHSRTFSIAPPRPPQTPAASFKSRYRKSSAFNIRRRLYMARLGLPINASDFWGSADLNSLEVVRGTRHPLVAIDVCKLVFQRRRLLLLRRKVLNRSAVNLTRCWPVPGRKVQFCQFCNLCFSKTLFHRD